MPARQWTSDDVMEQLRATPAQIRTAIAGATRARLHERPEADEWSANEVLAHVRACADVWGRCIDTILATDEPTIRAVNPRTWVRDTDYVEQDFTASLTAFTKQRRRLLTVLRRLDDAEWSRRAKITGAGKPLVRTVFDYAQWMAAHERPHIKQIARAVT